MEKITKNLQFVLLTVILVSTVIAVGIEIRAMIINQSVTLADLLLFFLYLEVLAMVRVFWDEQSISITLPLLIAITACSSEREPVQTIFPVLNIKVEVFGTFIRYTSPGNLSGLYSVDSKVVFISTKSTL